MFWKKDQPPQNTPQEVSYPMIGKRKICSLPYVYLAKHIYYCMKDEAGLIAVWQTPVQCGWKKGKPRGKKLITNNTNGETMKTQNQNQ